MAVVLKPKRGTNTPGTDDIVSGEIAIDTSAKKLYINDGGTVKEIGGGGAGGSTTDVTQSSHGFAVKDCIRHTGSAWTKARANSNSTLALGVVTAVADSNTFTVAQSGRFELTSHGLTVGQWYYLSESSAGALTTTEPAISQPLVYVESANFLFVFPYRPTNLLVSGQVPLGIHVDEFTGNGSTAAYTLGADPLSEDNTQVYINGVYQEKSTYAVSGTTLTFDTNVANGSSIEVVRYAASAVAVGVVDDNTVTTAKLASSSVTTDKIADDAVTSAKIADDAVVTAAIADDAITSALIADDAITSALIADDAITSALIADDAVVQAAIADDAVDEARLQISNAGSNGQFLSKQSGNTGGLTWATVSTTPAAGEIIEQLEGICDGNSITVQSGTYTLTNVTSNQTLSSTHTTINGSSISYTPPTGTTRVIYEFMVFMRDSDTDPILHIKGRVAGTDVDLSRHTWRGNGDNADYQRWIHNKMIITIGDVGSDDIANGRLQTWSSAKTLDFTAREYSSDYEGQFHMTNHWDGSGTDVLVKPTVRITAIA